MRTRGGDVSHMKEHRATVRIDGGFSIAYNYRSGEGADTIVFIHGFGSAKEHFCHAFTVPELAEFNVVALDLVGFGESRGPETFEYSMKDQAGVMLKVLGDLEIRSFHLCAHSMGGLVAMSMAGLEPNRVLSLIDMEGNLTLEDCFFSGKIARLTLGDFEKEGRRGFEKELKRAALDDPAMREYLETFSRASTVALHKSAVQTVAESSGALVDRLARIGNACYVYGEKNRGVYPGEKLLRGRGVPVFYVEDAGHSMATENPDGLYRIVREFIDGIPYGE